MAISIAASGNFFANKEARELEELEKESPLSSVTGSDDPEAGSLKDAGAGLSSGKQAIQLSISQFSLVVPLIKAARSSAFFKRTPQPSAFRVPSSLPYIDELSITSTQSLSDASQQVFAICAVATQASSCTVSCFYRVNMASPHPVVKVVLAAPLVCN